MSGAERGRSPSSRRLVTVPIVVEAGLLVLFAILLFHTLDPEFRGGRFVTATLLLGIAIVGTALVRDMAAALWGPSAHQEPAAGPLSDDDAANSTDWTTVAEAAATLAGVFLSIYVFGIVLGTALAAWVILIWQSKLSIGRALVGAVLVGIVLPVLFANALDLTLWPGIIPQVIAHWVGGGVPPPL